MALPISIFRNVYHPDKATMDDLDYEQLCAYNACVPDVLDQTGSFLANSIGQRISVIAHQMTIST